jgi:hypothetical protein
MKLIYRSSLILLLLIAQVANADPIDSIAWLIKQQNTTRLVELCAPMVEITVNGQENSYSKRQSLEFFQKFFADHKVLHSKLLHKVNSNQKFLFGVVLYDSDHGHYRIAYTLSNNSGAMRIIEMRIETEKTK